MVVEGQGAPPGANYGRGTVTLNVAVLDYRNPWPLMAHEVAHDVLGHEPEAVVGGGAWSGSGSARVAFQAPREHEANVKAVEVLVRVKGMSEEKAFREMLGWLKNYRRGVVDGLWPVPDGHEPPCRELLRFVDHWATKYPVVPRPACAA